MLLKQKLFLLFFLLSSFVFIAQGQGYFSKPPPLFVPHAEKLKQATIERCSLRTKSPPVGETDDPVSVDLALLPYNFYGINDRLQTFTVTADLQISWTHPCVEWRTSQPQFENVTYFEISAADTFYPKLNHLNSVDDISFLTRVSSERECFVNSDGLFSLVIPETFTSYCQLNLKQFPFDEQTCTLRFQSYYSKSVTKWHLHGNGISLTFNKSTFISQSDIWMLSELRAELKQTTYAEPIFHFKFRRHNQVYLVNLFYPNFCLSLLLIASGLMPPKMPDRPVFCVTVVLAYAVSQAYMNEALPQSSEIVYAALFMTFQTSIGIAFTSYTLLTCDLARRKLFRRSIDLHYSLGGRKLNSSVIRLVDMAFYGLATVIIFVIDGVIFGLMQ